MFGMQGWQLLTHQCLQPALLVYNWLFMFIRKGWGYIGLLRRLRRNEDLGKKDVRGSTKFCCQFKQCPTSQGCKSWQQHSTNVDTVKPFDGNKLIYQTRNGYDKNGHCCLYKIAACYPFWVWICSDISFNKQQRNYKMLVNAVWHVGHSLKPKPHAMPEMVA